VPLPRSSGGDAVADLDLIEWTSSLLMSIFGASALVVPPVE
jgi:hypothetical protein